MRSGGEKVSLDVTDLSRANWLHGAEARSLLAFGLACLATLAVVTLALTSDGSHVRWWLVAVPLIATAVAVAVPRPELPLAASVLLVVWCLLGGVSVGFLLLPAALALLLAVSVDRERRSAYSSPAHRLAS